MLANSSNLHLPTLARILLSTALDPQEPPRTIYFVQQSSNVKIDWIHLDTTSIILIHLTYITIKLQRKSTSLFFISCSTLIAHIKLLVPTSRGF